MITSLRYPLAPLDNIEQQPIYSTPSLESMKKKGGARNRQAAPPKKKTVYDKFDSDEEEYEDEDDEPPSKRRGRRSVTTSTKGRKLTPTTGRTPRSTAGRKKSFDDGADEESPEMAECGRILAALLKHANSWPYAEPVDPVKLGIMDYFTVIKHPMDLGTIKESLESGEYSTPEDFAEDVRLVWRNAMTYNPADHQIHKWAQQLSGIFEKKFSKIGKA